MTHRKLIEQLLEALDIAYSFEGDVFGIHHNDTVDAIQEAKAYLAAPEQSEPNNDEVICPNCCTQFRAIPVNVQQLMLDAGFEPPFTAQGAKK